MNALTRADSPRAQPRASDLAPSIGAVVLAAGGSSRLGRPKQLVVHEGLPLVARAARAAVLAGADPVVVVLGANKIAVRETLSALDVLTTVNAEWEDGMGTSLAAGVRALLAHSPSLLGVLVTLVDQPLIDESRLKQLLDAWIHADARADDGTHATIAAATYAEIAGVPAVFGRAHFVALCALQGAAGANALLRAEGGRIRRVPMPEAAVDVDTQDDLDRLDAAGAR